MAIELEIEDKSPKTEVEKNLYRTANIYIHNYL